MTRRTRLVSERLDDRCLPSFGPAASYDVGTYPRDVATGDFNSDGRLDLATVSTWFDFETWTQVGRVGVLLGNADGTFQPARTIAVDGYSSSVAVGDFDSDGKLDLAANGPSGSDGLHLLIGNGDGTFRPPLGVPFWSLWEGYGGATSVAEGDFDADGLMDLAVSTGYDLYDYGSVEVLRGDGQGGFTSLGITWMTAFSGSELAVADLTADGKPEVVAVHEHRGTVSVLINNGHGSLDAAGWFATGPSPRAVAAGEFTGDGIPDLVTVGESVDVLPGNGNGTFGAPNRYFDGGSGHVAVAAADFDRDGRPDVATVNSYGVNVLRGRGDGSFDTPEIFAVGYGAVAAGDFGDFGGDGWADVAVASGPGVAVLLNDQSWPPLPPAPPPAVSVGDATVTEGNTGTVNATFTLTLSRASAVDVTVRYATADGTAAAGSDYQAASGTLTFAPGETSKTITVAVFGDQMVEPNETFTVTLSNPGGASIGDGTGLGTVMNDDTAPPRISISDVTLKEGRNGNTMFVFTVTLSAPSATQVTVTYATADGTARAGEDYEAAGGTLTFAPGETTKTVTIKVKGDRTVEADETFFVNLSGATGNAVLLDPQGLGTILNDD